MRHGVGRSVLLIGIFVLILCAGSVDAQQIKPLTLDNGLEIYQLPDSTVPLVSFVVAFRTGAFVETPEYNGLSHLYEHMLFKANELYKSQEEFDSALKAMGCPSWNGGTGTEIVSYYATVPSDQLENVIKFWAYTVRTNYVVATELEKEKDVVINELKMYEGDPSRVFYQTIMKSLFSEYYSRKDIGGSVDVVRNATAEQLEWLKKTYYVPNNCAVFITGTFESDQAIAFVKKYFGDWQKVANPFEAYPVPKHPNLTESKQVIIPTLASDAYYTFGRLLRGPDVMDEVEDTYAADILGYVTGRRSGKFLTALEPVLWRKEALSLGYYTQRNGGSIMVQVQMLVGPDAAGNQQALTALQQAIDVEIEKMATDAAYFSADDIAQAIRSIEAEKLYSAENKLNEAESISFWWATSSTDYYSTYIEKLRQVQGQDIMDFVNRYLYKKPAVQYYWLSPTVAEQLGLEVAQ